MPTSTLSRRIAELESAVGARLLNRTTRSIELTEAGAVYYARCREIVEAARVAHEQLGDLIDMPRGRLRVSTTAEFARLFLGPLVADYAALYPDVALELDMQPHKVDLIAENYDLALRIGAQPDSSMIARRLGMVRVALFAAPQYLEAAGEPRGPDDLSRHAVICNLNSPNANLWSLSNLDRSVEVEVSTRLQVNNFGFMRQLALLGLGITTLHEPMVEADVAAGRLRRVLPDWLFREAPVYALTPSRLLPAKTRLFLKILTEQISRGCRPPFPSAASRHSFIPRTG